MGGQLRGTKIDFRRRDHPQLTPLIRSTQVGGSESEGFGRDSAQAPMTFRLNHRAIYAKRPRILTRTENSGVVTGMAGESNWWLCFKRVPQRPMLSQSGCVCDLGLFLFWDSFFDSSSSISPIQPASKSRTTYRPKRQKPQKGVAFRGF